MQLTAPALNSAESFKLQLETSGDTSKKSVEIPLKVLDDNKETSKIAQFMQEEQELAKQRREKTADSIESAVQTVSEFAKLQNLKLNFTEKLHNGSAVVQVVDIENDKIVRQIPSEEFLRVAGRISEIITDTQKVKGLLFESEV